MLAKVITPLKGILAAIFLAVFTWISLLRLVNFPVPRERVLTREMLTALATSKWFVFCFPCVVFHLGNSREMFVALRTYMSVSRVTRR